MRRIEFCRRLEEASCGVRGELLNRGSGVRISAPAPFLVFSSDSRSGSDIANCIANGRRKCSHERGTVNLPVGVTAPR